MNSKPDCKLIGVSDNIITLLGIAARTLQNVGLSEQAKEMSTRVWKSRSFDEALCVIRTPPVTQIKDLLRVPGTLKPSVIGEYVNILGSDAPS